MLGRGMVYRRQMQMTLASDALADVAVFRFSHIHDGGDAALEQALVSFLAMLPTDMQLRRDFTVFAAGDAIAPPVEVFLDTQLYGTRAGLYELDYSLCRIGRLVYLGHAGIIS